MALYRCSNGHQFETDKEPVRCLTKDCGSTQISLIGGLDDIKDSKESDE